MMAVLLALSAAIVYGTADFGAGLLSRRMHYTLVSVLAQVSATIAVGAVLPFTGSSSPTMATLSWGALSGVGGALGTLALYRGLGRAQMSVVAPLSAVGAAGLPAVASFVFGQFTSASAIVGIVLALPALWLVARPADGGVADRSAIGDGLLAGTGFAVLFIALDRAGHAQGLWPVAAGQVSSLMILATLLVKHRLTRRSFALPPTSAALGVGLLNASAIVLYFLATRFGALSVVAVLTSLYPAVTILLAAVVLRERATTAQRIGLALTAAAIILITAG